MIAWRLVIPGRATLVASGDALHVRALSCACESPGQYDRPGCVLNTVQGVTWQRLKQWMSRLAMPLSLHVLGRVAPRRMVLESNT
jgi:hypothetical protein